jgi:hypothetical protein
LVLDDLSGSTMWAQFVARLMRAAGRAVRVMKRGEQVTPVAFGLRWNWWGVASLGGDEVCGTVYPRSTCRTMTFGI